MRYIGYAIGIAFIICNLPHIIETTFILLESFFVVMAVYIITRLIWESFFEGGD